MTKSTKRYPIYEQFREEIKNFIEKKGIHHYQFAATAEVSPAYLSLIITGPMLFTLNDPKIKRIADAIGYKGKCFVMDICQSTAAKQ